MTTYPHTDKEFERELRALKDRLLIMGGRCEGLIRRACFALERRDLDLKGFIEETDERVNADEHAVNDLATRILALRQPAGRDLRFVIAALKCVVDLERIGDEVVNVAERAEDLAGIATRLPLLHSEIARMMTLSAEMLQRTLDGLVRDDPQLASSVMDMDKDVDAAYNAILREAMEHMAKCPDEIQGAMSIVSCAKHVERIADHTTNIAEMIVYFVQGPKAHSLGKRSAT